MITLTILLIITLLCILVGCLMGLFSLVGVIASLIAGVLVGALAGYVAGRFMGTETSLGRNILMGILGSFVGEFGHPRHRQHHVLRHLGHRCLHLHLDRAEAVALIQVSTRKRRFARRTAYFPAESGVFSKTSSHKSFAFHITLCYTFISRKARTFCVLLGFENRASAFLLFLEFIDNNNKMLPKAVRHLFLVVVLCYIYIKDTSCAAV